MRGVIFIGTVINVSQKYSEVLNWTKKLKKAGYLCAKVNDRMSQVNKVIESVKDKKTHQEVRERT